MAKAEAQAILSRLEDPQRQETREKIRTGDAEGTARKAGAAALDRKADDVVLIDLRKQSSYADFLVICSGTNERQLEAIAEAVTKTLRDAGQAAIGSEGIRGGRW